MPARSERLRVVCVGILAADIACEPVPRVPNPGELLLTEKIAMSLGGCAANAAVGLTRLGLAVDIVGKVGDDAFGRFIVDTLEGEGICARGVEVTGDIGTSKTMLLLTEKEDRRFIHMIGANGTFGVDDVDFGLFKGARAVYVGGYLVMPRLDQAGLMRIFTEARSAGALTVLDVVSSGGDDLAGKFEKVMPLVDVFLPNEDEARDITGETDPERQASRFLEQGVGTVVITMGARGALACTRDKRIRSGVYSVPLVDGSGGGDAFDAGLIYGLTEGLGLEDSVKFASAMGASCVRAVGTTKGLFARKEAEEFIRSNPLDMEVL